MMKNTQNKPQKSEDPCRRKSKRSYFESGEDQYLSDITQGKFDNLSPEVMNLLRDAHQRAGYKGVRAFLEEHKTESDYADLYKRTQEELGRTEREKTTILERELAKRGIEVRTDVDECGIDPSTILMYKDLPNGRRMFLCYDDKSEKELYYTIRISPKTTDYKEAMGDYESG